MFLGSDIIEFINKIIDANDTQNDNKLKNIENFRDYLKLTKMADEETLKYIDKIIKCMPEILALKQKLGSFDLNSILIEEQKNIEKKDQVKVKQKVKIYEEKHYNHYHSNSSSPCGSSSSSYDPCCCSSRVTNSRC